MLSMGKKRSEYKNAKRSKKMIINAYIELIQEKDINKITITDIVNKADLNRGTFYRHYDYPRQILEQIQNEVIEKINEVIKEIEYKNIIKSPLSVINKVSEFIESNLFIYKKLVNIGESELFITELKEMVLAKIFSDTDIPKYIRKNIEIEMYILYTIGGVVTLYQAWLLDKIDCSLEELTETIKRMISQATNLL